MMSDPTEGSEELAGETAQDNGAEKKAADPGAEVAAQVMAAVGHVQAVRLGAQPTVIPAAKVLEDQVLVSETGIELALLQLLRR